MRRTLLRSVRSSTEVLVNGVINDGAAPGQRSGDGAYVPAQ